MSTLWDKVIRFISRETPTYKCADGTLIKLEDVSSLGPVTKAGSYDIDCNSNKFRVHFYKGGFVDLPHTEYESFNSALIGYDQRWALPDEPDYNPNA